MKKLINSTLMGMVLFSVVLVADDLNDRGGKFGHKLESVDTLPPVNTIDDLSLNRSSCYSYVWHSASLHGRWWDYWIYRKVSAYAYSKTTYGNSKKSCNIPYKAKSMYVDLFLTNFYSYAHGAANRYGNDILDIKSKSNTNYLKASGTIEKVGGHMGDNILSYHETKLGWYTFKNTRVINWK